MISQDKLNVADLFCQYVADEKIMAEDKHKERQRVAGTDQSEYEGLYGFITEIRDGEDKETENDTPDVYCTFEPSVLPYDITEMEEYFSELRLLCRVFGRRV